MSNKWKIFWVASFALVVFFQACGMHSWEEAVVSTADEKKMGREFDSLVRIGDKSVVSADESLFKPKTAADSALFTYYQDRAKSVVGKISSADFDALLTSEKLCRNNPDNANEKVACNKSNFFEFNIIKSKTKNAFAVPGGYVYFYTAILKDFKSESELVGVFSHEVGHVVKHHSRESIVKQVGASAIISLLLGDGMGATLASLGASFWLLGNSRDNEAEADVMGFEYTNALGISSEGLGDFFARGLKSYDPVTGKCDEEKEGSFLDVFSTHPPSCERVNSNKERIVKAGQNYPRDVNKANGKYFTELVSAAAANL